MASELAQLVFQSRKQDYFNWKKTAVRTMDGYASFSPASRIILIERASARRKACDSASTFQSRKQDYFNWKDW